MLDPITQGRSPLSWPLALTWQRAGAPRHAWTGVCLGAALALMLGASGCSTNTNTADAGASADTSTADVQEDVPPEDVLVAPKLSVTLEASPKSGNAPLPVEFTATVTGDDPANLFIEWDFGDASLPKVYDLGNPEEAGGLHVKNTYTYKSTYNAHVKVYWRYSNKVKAEASVTVTVSEPVDLSVSGIDLVSNPSVGMGSEVSLTFAVENTGDEVAVPFDVGIYLSTTATLDDAARLVHTETIKNMASGKSSQSVVYFGNDPAAKTSPSHFKVPGDMPDGDYFILVMVDPKHALNENNQLDNFGVGTSLLNVNNKVAALPDLVISAPDFDSALSYSPGDAVTYSHEVSNIGDGEAKASKYAVFLSADNKLDYNPAKDPEDPSQIDHMLTKLATSNLLKLSAKATLPLNYSAVIPDVPDGNYYLIAAIDVKDQVLETNESNNVSVGTSTVTVKKVVKTGVDLALLGISVKPKGTFLNGQIGVEWTVKNAGNQQIATPSPGSIYFCPDKAFSKNTCITNQKNFTIPALAAGETKVNTELVTIAPTTPVQNYYIYVRVDPDNVVQELDEGNNVQVFDKLILTAQQNVDLAPDAVGVHPTDVVAGEKIKISYTVKNTGTTGSAASTTWIALSKDNACGAALVNTGLNVVIDESVDAGADALSEVDVTKEVTVPVGLDHTVNSWYVCVILDAKNANTKETNKTNNAAASPAPFNLKGAKGGCFEDNADSGGASNNTQGTAAPLAAGATQTLGSCGNDDWWTVDVPLGNSLIVTMTSTPLLSTVPIAADLDLEIWAPDGKTLLDGQKLTSPTKKAAALTVANGGKHFIHVAPKANGSKAQYTLLVQVIPPAKGIDLYAGQLTASPNATFPGALIKTKLRLTNLGDKPAGAFTVRYLLSQDPAYDPADKVLKEIDFATGMGASQTIDSTQVLLLPIVPGGAWYVLAQVDSKGVIGETSESNNVAASNVVQLNATQSCQPDPYAGNHTANDAAALPPSGGLIKGLNVCPGLPDWFKVEVPTGKALTAQLNWKYQPGQGLVGVQIIDASKTGVLAGAASATLSKATIPYVQVGGTFYIHIYVLPEANAIPYDYELNLTVGQPDASDVCLADAYESNNSAQSAPEVGCGQASLSLCLGDEDWFKLVLKKDEAITFDFNHPGNSFQLKLFANPNLPPIKTQGGNGKLLFAAPSDGEYYLQVAYKSPGVKPANGFGYTLFVDGGKGVDLIAKIKSVFPAQVVQGEDIYMTVTLSNACQDPAGDFWYGYYFSLDNKLDATDQLMSLKPMPGLVGKTSKDVDDKAMVPVDAKPGPAYVIVAADATQAVVESQELNNTDAAAMEVIKLCLADAMEPNGAPQIASPLLMGRVKDLSLCPYDLDWYTIDLKKGETLTVTADFVQSVGDLDIRLYKVAKFGTPVAVSATKAAPEQFTYTADEATKYYLRVSGFAGDANAYQLIACKSMTGKCIECLDDSVCSPTQQCDPVSTLCGAKLCTPANLAPCNDANQCTTDECIGGKCANNSAASQFCSDGDPCTIGETCDQSGTCAVPSDTQAISLPSTATSLVDLGTDISATSDGGYVVVGGMETQPGELRGYVARYDNLGKNLWAKSYVTGNAPNLLQAVRVVGKEIVAVGLGGLADKPGTNGAWYLRLALADGAVVASKLLQVGNSSANLQAVVSLTATDVIVAGAGYDPGASGNSQDGWIARLDYDGNPLWSNFVGGTGPDVLYDLALLPLPSGSTATQEVIGVGQDDQSGVLKGLFVRFNTGTGSLTKQATVVGGTGNTTLLTVAALAGGQVVAGGASDAGQALSKPPIWQAFLARLDAGGTLTSSAQYPATTPQASFFAGVKTSRIEGISVRPDGSLAAVGYTGSSSEKLFGNDGFLWLVGADNQVTKSWYVGKAAMDVLHGVAPWSEGWVAVGSLAEFDPTSDLLRLIILPNVPECNDFNVCTVDSCAAGKGCGHTNVADGTACGASAACLKGVCTPK